MRILGIDYGTKNVGVSISDENQKLAFPKNVFSNNADLISNLKNIIDEYGIIKIVVGESLNFDMKENPIMIQIKAFKEKIEKETGSEVVLFPEVLTSHQAAKMAGTKNDMIDASAATIMLQSYLDSINK